MIIYFDLIRYISFFLKFQDILDFSIITKDTYKALDNLFYKNLAYNTYGVCFWLKASCRNPIVSKPLKNFKLELLRIENFQRNLDNINISRWTKKDFYNYWKYV